MTIISKRFARWLDNSVEWTGIPRRVRQHADGVTPKRRPLKWLPLCIPALATTGFAAIWLLPGRWIGLTTALLSPLMSTTVLVVMRGPLKPWLEWREIVDERDRDERNRAYLFALFVALIVMALTMVGVAWALVTDSAHPIRLAEELFQSIIFCMILINTLPTLYASFRAKHWLNEDDTH